MVLLEVTELYGTRRTNIRVPPQRTHNLESETLFLIANYYLLFLLRHRWLSRADPKIPPGKYLVLQHNSGLSYAENHGG